MTAEKETGICASNGQLDPKRKKVLSDTSGSSSQISQGRNKEGKGQKDGSV